jgi:hypothetical protein
MSLSEMKLKEAIELRGKRRNSNSRKSEGRQERILQALETERQREINSDKRKRSDVFMEQARKGRCKGSSS